ncbi:Oxysterol-binding 4 [Venturia nashicola]|uniref:Oxysterol-binding 4 n=1 Tax=Venturia nashicola TaxID=86259 RepID=A0A4Z1P8I2_9PEZI|nr:Oxysterol-binding 4 [Venturia nashicola]
MAPPPERVLEAVRAHLQAVQDDPSTQLDDTLLETAGYVLLPVLSPPQTQALVLQLYQILPALQQDPEPAVRLLTKLLEPIPLSAILSLEPPVDFVQGLNVAAEPFNLLTLSLLEKADIASARRLASVYQPLFVALITLWLSTENERVADKASKVLITLLRVDMPGPDTVAWDGPVWKRIFRDKDVYEQIFAITSLKAGKSSLSKNRKTIAQARLMDWLPIVGGLDWPSISQSYHPEIENSYGLPPAKQSLLDYVATFLVDYKGDVLMHRSLMKFYNDLLTVIAPTASRGSALLFLKTQGHHERTAMYYIQPDHPSHDPIDKSFLYGPAALYVASWATLYPEDFTKSTEVAEQVVNKIASALEISPARWAHGYSPAEDLHVLASLPGPYLASLGSRSPHLAIPSKAANSDALNTLATLFHGPIPLNTITFPPTVTPRTDQESEPEAAKELYTSYFSLNPSLWKDATSHADTVALKEQALAAINLIKAVVTAPWNGISTLTNSSARSTVVPWLLGPPKTFSNLVGGHGDAESAAYVIATSKFDVLRAFFARVKDMEGDEYRLMEGAARERMTEGTFGGRRGEIGGRIATMDL